MPADVVPFPLPPPPRQGGRDVVMRCRCGSDRFRATVTVTAGGAVDVIAPLLVCDECGEGLILRTA